MHPLSLTDVERAVRDSWSADTSTPEFRSQWSPDNPGRDRCGVTALVINDLLGGDLVRGEVHVDGEPVGFHWWNRLGLRRVEGDVGRGAAGCGEIGLGRVDPEHPGGLLGRPDGVCERAGPAADVAPSRRWPRRQPLQEPRRDQPASPPDVRFVGLAAGPRLGRTTGHRVASSSIALGAEGKDAEAGAARVPVATR